MAKKNNKAGRKRPLTQKEIQAKKRQTDDTRATITVVNTSRQVIPIHVKPAPGIDFYQGAQDIRLNPGQKMTFPKKRLWSTQIDRLQKRRFLQVFSDTEKSNDKKKEIQEKRARAAKRKEIEEAEGKKKKVVKKKKSPKKKASISKPEVKKDSNIQSNDDDTSEKHSSSDE